MIAKSLALIRAALTKWRFAFLLALVMLVFEYSVIFGIIALTPKDHFWLGATITNSSDTAVYLSYLEQSANSLFLHNFFAGPDHIARLDPFWSLGGLLVRLGLSPVFAHELLRVFTTIILAFAIFATAKSVTRAKKHAQVTSWLMLSGLSTGWLYSVFMSIAGLWKFGSPVPSDLSNEFALAPILLGGAHMILSPALLLLNTRWIWQIINKERALTVLPILTIAYHAGFHPYYIPIYGLIAIFALVKNINPRSLKSFLIINLSLIPGATYYLYLILRDPKFREHHLIANTLPLDPLWMWLIMLLPIIIAYVWILWHKNKINLDGKAWVWAWLASAIICFILPLPWNRKFTSTLLPALVILTLPFWLRVYDGLKPKTDFILKCALTILLAFPFLHLMQSQLALASDPFWNRYFYAQNQTLAAWNILKPASDINPIISTDLYTCLWIPAYSGKYVWIGHNHETPNFEQRYTDYQVWQNTTSSRIFNDFLDNNRINGVLTDKNSYNDLFNNNWILEYNEKNISLWTRKLD